MKYQDKSFSVPMPGNKAAQWPKCDCGLDMGHKEKCRPFEQPSGSLGEDVPEVKAESYWTWFREVDWKRGSIAADDTIVFANEPTSLPPTTPSPPAFAANVSPLLDPEVVEVITGLILARVELDRARGEVLNALAAQAPPMPQGPLEGKRLIIDRKQP